MCHIRGPSADSNISIFFLTLLHIEKEEKAIKFERQDKSFLQFLLQSLCVLNIFTNKGYNGYLTRSYNSVARIKISLEE